MNRNLLCGSLLGTGACLAAALPAVAAGTGERPNILFIVADDLGWGDVGYHGSVIPTPNIDALAARGIEMNRFYTAPVSSPTRAGLMTGRYPSRFGIRKTVIPPWRDYGLDPEEQTLADMLAANGYAHRAIVGKWHLGHGRRAYYPLNRGFTHFYGCLNGALDYFTHEREGELDWHNDWESCRDEGYSTDLIADEAVRCIGEYASEGPFFLYVAFNAPHTPFQAPEDEIAEHISSEKFAALTPREKDAYTYRAMVTRMDKGVGRILEKLERSGLVENTLVLFMSDNGGLASEPAWRDGELHTQNYPLNSGKGSLYEGGIREPMIVKWPGVVSPGTRCDKYLMIEDFYPTILEMAGVQNYRTVQPLDGTSFMPLLKGTGDPSKGRAIVWNFPNIWGNNGPGINLNCSIRKDEWKLVYYYETGKKELFNIPEDIGEKHDVAAQHPDIVKRLSKELGTYLRNVGGQRPGFKATNKPCPWPDEV